MTAPSASKRGERYFAKGERVMFLKNDRELGVKNGSLGIVTEVSGSAMRVVLDGAERREVTRGVCGARLRLRRHRT